MAVKLGKVRFFYSQQVYKTREVTHCIFWCCKLKAMRIFPEKMFGVQLWLDVIFGSVDQLYNCIILKKFVNRLFF